MMPPMLSIHPLPEVYTMPSLFVRLSAAQDMIFVGPGSNVNANTNTNNHNITGDDDDDDNDEDEDEDNGRQIVETVGKQ